LAKDYIISKGLGLKFGALGDKFQQPNLYPALSISMHYVYILKHPETSFIYIGYSNDVQRRLKEHEIDKPDWKLVYYEAYFSKKDATTREKQLKHYGSSIGHLRKRIDNGIKEI